MALSIEWCYNSDIYGTYVHMCVERPGVVFGEFLRFLEAPCSRFHVHIFYSHIIMCRE